MSDEPFTAAECAAVRSLLRADVAQIDDPDVRQSLLSKQIVRLVDDRLSVTLRGHVRYLKALAKQFD